MIGRIPPGVGLVGFDGGVKRAVTMVAPARLKNYVLEDSCGFDCGSSFTITFSGITGCPGATPPYYVSDSGINATFVLPGGTIISPSDPYSCGWGNATLPPTTVTVFVSDDFGEVTFPVDITVFCFQGQITASINVNAAGYPGAPYGIFGGFLGGPNLVNCSDPTQTIIMSGGNT